MLGISPDASKRLAKFVERDGLNFTLLSDEDHAVADKYGAWGPKKFMGREFDGILRTTFIVGKDGRLKAVLDNFKTKTHHEDLLAALDSLCPEALRGTMMRSGYRWHQAGRAPAMSVLDGGALVK